MKTQSYLFIAANECPWGGSEVLWSRAAEKLANDGNKVRVSAPRFAESSSEIRRLRAAGCEICFRRPFERFYIQMARKFFKTPDYPLEHARAISEGVDLVIISQGAAIDGLQWLEIARKLGLKYTVIVQGASEFNWPRDEEVDRLGPAFENATRSYYVSEATMELCARQFGTPLKNGKVIRNPFNVGYDVKLPWPDGLPDELSLGCVGRLEVMTKGQDVLLEVLGLPHWRERKVQISFYGTGAQERALARRAKDLKLAGVEFCGHQNDIEKVWSKHHALVLSSRQEGMPLVVVEAMLCGRPCIATDVGGNRELIRDGVNGFLVKAATVELVDEVMNRAWENRSRLRAMGETAAADVRQWVSEDPAGDFARDLANLVNARGSEAVSATLQPTSLNS